MVGCALALVVGLVTGCGGSDSSAGDTEPATAVASGELPPDELSLEERIAVDQAVPEDDAAIDDTYADEIEEGDGEIYDEEVADQVADADPLVAERTVASAYAALDAYLDAVIAEDGEDLAQFYPDDCAMVDDGMAVTLKEALIEAAGGLDLDDIRPGIDYYIDNDRVSEDATIFLYGLESRMEIIDGRWRYTCS